MKNKIINDKTNLDFSSLRAIASQSRKNYSLLIIIMLCFALLPSSSFAKSKLKTKLSNFFQKIEKKLDTKTDDTASKTSNIRIQIASAPVIVASTTKKLTLDDYGLLPQKQVKIDILLQRKLLGNFDVGDHRFYACQGITTDGEYFYVALLNLKKNKSDDQATMILKIRMSDLVIVDQKDFGLIGHSNSLTYNPKTKKIYVAPLWKTWKTIYEFDTNLNNLKQVTLYNNDGTIYKDKEFRSVTYLPLEDQYIVVIGDTELAYFDSEFKLLKILKLNKSLRKTTTQALSSDGTNLYAVTNIFRGKPFVSNDNLIIIYDMDGNYIDTYLFPQEFGYHVELQQITFANGKCYGVSINGNMRIYEIKLKKNKYLDNNNE